MAEETGAADVPGGVPPPPPPPSPEPEPSDAMVAPEVVAEEAAAHEPEDRFRTWVAIAIAVVSILGAVVAFTGTIAGQDARRLDQQGIQDAARQQQIITDLQGTVNEDLRYLAPYQEHLKAAQLLEGQATTLDATDPASASLLRAEAQSERVLARTVLGYFRGAVPDPGKAGDPVKYDPAAALQRLENNNADLQQLRPDATLAAADDKHNESVHLVGLVTLFIAALLFLTLAQFTRPAIRRLFAAAGGGTALVGLALWLLVLRAGP